MVRGIGHWRYFWGWGWLGFWRCGWGSRGDLARYVESRLAKAIDQVLDKLWVPDFPKLCARYGRIIRPERKQFVHGASSAFFFPQLSVDCSQGHFGEREAWHVDLERHAQSGAVVVLAISMEECSVPIPS